MAVGIGADSDAYVAAKTINGTVAGDVILYSVVLRDATPSNTPTVAGNSMTKDKSDNAVGGVTFVRAAWWSYVCDGSEGDAYCTSNLGGNQMSSWCHVTGVSGDSGFYSTEYSEAGGTAYHDSPTLPNSIAVNMSVGHNSGISCDGILVDNAYWSAYAKSASIDYKLTDGNNVTFQFYAVRVGGYLYTFYPKLSGAQAILI